jgi:hypothetical protein
MRALMLGLLIAGTWSSLAHACATVGGHFAWNSKTETVTTMTTESGKECLVLTWSAYSTAFASVRVSAQARNGVADIKDGSSWRYRSRPGFKGNDEFAIHTCANLRNGKGCATVRVKVTVY